MILLAVVRHIPGCRGYFAMSQHDWVLFCRSFSCPGLTPLLDPSPLLPCPARRIPGDRKDPRGDRRDPRGDKPSPALLLPREPLRSTDHAGFALPPKH